MSLGPSSIQLTSTLNIHHVFVAFSLTRSLSLSFSISTSWSLLLSHFFFSRWMSIFAHVRCTMHCHIISVLHCKTVLMLICFNNIESLKVVQLFHLVVLYVFFAVNYFKIEGLAERLIFFRINQTWQRHKDCSGVDVFFVCDTYTHCLANNKKHQHWILGKSWALFYFRLLCDEEKVLDGYEVYHRTTREREKLQVV